MRPIQLIFPVDQDFANNLAERLIRLRQREGLTQVQVAERLGVSQATYAHYERGFRRAPMERIPALAQALNASEEELFGLEPSKKKRGPSSQLEQRFERIRALPPKEQRFILEALDRLLGENSMPKAS